MTVPEPPQGFPLATAQAFQTGPSEGPKWSLSHSPTWQPVTLEDGKIVDDFRDGDVLVTVQDNGDGEG